MLTPTVVFENIDLIEEQLSNVTKNIHSYSVYDAIWVVVAILSSDLEYCILEPFHSLFLPLFLCGFTIDSFFGGLRFILVCMGV